MNLKQSEKKQVRDGRHTMVLSCDTHRLYAGGPTFGPQGFAGPAARSQHTSAAAYPRPAAPTPDHARQGRVVHEDDDESLLADWVPEGVATRRPAHGDPRLARVSRPDVEKVKEIVLGIDKICRDHLPVREAVADILRLVDVVREKEWQVSRKVRDAIQTRMMVESVFAAKLKTLHGAVAETDKKGEEREANAG